MRPWALFVARLLAACGTPSKLNYYTLDTSAPPAAGAGSSHSVFVGPVTVPDSVDRAEFVLGVAPNQVELEELQNTVGECVRYRKNILGRHLPPPPAPW